MRAHWTTDLDIEMLESRRSWASLGEFQMVVPFHIQRYKEILEECRKKIERCHANRLNVCHAIPRGTSVC